MDAPYAVSTAYVLQTGTSPALGSRFRVVTTDVSTMTFLAATPNPAFVHYGDAPTGIDIGYTGCQSSYPLLLVTVTYLGFGQTPGCESISVAAHPDAASGVAEVLDCQNQYRPVSTTAGRVSVDGSCECPGFVYRTATVSTEPPGLDVSVDDATYTSPAEFQWLESELHTVSAPAEQGSLKYLAWSDGGARAHTVAAGGTDLFLTATYIEPVEASGPVIGIYADEYGSSCQLTDIPYQVITAYVLHLSDTPANSSQFRIQNSPDFGLLPLSQTPNPAYLALGTAYGGITITYVGCKTTFPLTLMTLTYFGLGESPPCSYIDVVPDPAVPSGRIEVLDCSSNRKFVAGGRLSIDGDGSCICGPGALLPAVATVTTTPPGIGIVVDGTPYVAPADFSWMPGSSHTVSVDSVHTGGGSISFFTHWSDGGAPAHFVTMPSGHVTYRAVFETHATVPVITAIADVADDQGGAVRIHWNACYDDNPARVDPVESYVVFRSNGTPFVAETAFDSVLTVPATGAPVYEGVAPTLWDSTGWLGVWFSKFYVQARSQSGVTNFTSTLDSAYSADNIAPAPPTEFAVDYNAPTGNVLSWTAPGDVDYVSTAVYRHLDPDFVPSPDNRIVYTHSPWTDNVPDGYTYSYKIRAVDKSANESTPAVPGLVTGVSGRDIPRVVVLKQNSPNPFNPTTRIEFSLPVEGVAVLRVFDVAGRLIRRLHDGHAPRGFTAVVWDGTNDTGNQVGSGVYFYQLRAGQTTLTLKMVLLK
jgi:hypothetical protein